MRRPRPDARPGGSADLGPRPRRSVFGVYQFVSKTFTIVRLEVWKLRRDPTELITRAVQPMLWLLLFGEVFTRLRAIPTGNRPYLDFMAPGILAQSVLFVAIFYGISAIWERDLGLIHKLMATPTPRSALVLGKALAAGVRALSQAAIIYLLALALGVGIDWNPFAILGVLVLVVAGAALFATFSLIVATIVRTRERFMGIGQVLTMPLFFASNAIYPLAIMPGWMQAISRINPLSYEVDGVRALMLWHESSTFGLINDFVVVAVVTAVLLVIAGRLYPRLAR